MYFPSKNTGVGCHWETAGARIPVLYWIGVVRVGTLIVLDPRGKAFDVSPLSTILAMGFS